MKKYLVPLFILAILTTAIYGGTLNYPFVFDDNNGIVENPTLREASNIPRFFTTLHMAGENDSTGLYRPLVFSSYALNFLASGLATFSYHLVDVLLHILDAFLLFLLLTELQSKDEKWSNNTSLLFAVLFCVHPVLTQSVIFISARSVLLMTAFCLSSLWFYVRYRSTGRPALLVMSAFLFVCALLSKEACSPFLGVFLLYEYYIYKTRSENLRTSLAKVAPFVIAAVTFVVVRLFFLSRAKDTLVTGNYRAHWLAEISVLPRYIVLILNPFGLSIEHYIPDSSLVDFYFLSGVAVIAAALALFVLFLKKDKLLACLFAWPFLTLLPEMVIPIPERMMEYRLYLPMAGVVIFLAALFHRTFDNNPLRLKPVLAALASLVLALGIVSFERTKVWASPLSVWQDAVAKKPKRAKAYILYGVELARQGSFVKARECLEEAVRLEPYAKNVEAYINLGNVYAETGELKKAAETQLKAIEINNKSMGAYMNLALVYLNMKEFDAAYRTYIRMAEVFPDNREILLMGADNLRMHGRNSDADSLVKLYEQEQ